SPAMIMPMLRYRCWSRYATTWTRFTAPVPTAETSSMYLLAKARWPSCLTSLLRSSHDRLSAAAPLRAAGQLRRDRGGRIAALSDAPSSLSAAGAAGRRTRHHTRRRVWSESAGHRLSLRHQAGEYRFTVA